MMIYTSVMMDHDLKEERSVRHVSGRVKMIVGYQILSIESTLDGHVELTYLANPNREEMVLSLELYRTGEYVNPGLDYIGQTDAPGGTKYIFGRVAD